MKLVKKLKYILISFLALFIPIGICTWAISGAIKKEQLKAEYVVSPFTEYVLNPSSGNVIYDDTTNASGYLGYDVSSDFTYDTSDKIIELGDPKVDRGIDISNSITFGHSSNKDLNYSEDQFSNSGAFANDGTVVTSTTRLYPNSKYATNRLYTIKLTSDVVLTNNSTLSIGALIGTNAPNGSSGGVINGDFVCLDLNGHNLTISSGCVLNAYGYIVDSKVGKNGKHVGSIINNGTIYTGFVVEDYNGGGITVGRGFSSQMPFSLYSLPYLSCKVVNNYGSSIKVPTMLYANELMNKTIINWYGAGNDYFLQSKTEGSILIIDTYNNLSADGKSYAENMRSFYNFDGDFKTNNLKLEILFQSSVLSVNAVIDMAQFAFYVPPYADLTLSGENSTFDLNLLLQFLPGSSLKTEENTTLTFSSTDFNSYVAPFNASGLSKSIKPGTSHGGIIGRTEMPPSINTGYAYTRTEDSKSITNSLYNFDYNHYNKYNIEENDRLSSGDSRIKILGNLSIQTTSQLVLSGFFEMSDSALIDLNNNIASINAFPHLAETFGNVNGAGPLASWYFSTDNPRPTEISYGGYINQPLVVANANNQSDTRLIGRVFNPQRSILNVLSNDVYYNFRKGYFYDVLNKKYYVFDLNDNIGSVASNLNAITVQGTFKEIDGIDDNGYVTIDGSKHIFYQNAFVETEYPGNNYMLNGSGLYIYDSITGSYNKIDNGSVNYTYEAERYSIDYRAASQVGEYETKAQIVGSQDAKVVAWTPWYGSGIDRGDWSSLPYVDFYYEVPDSKVSLGTQTTSSRVNVINIQNISGVSNDVDTSGTIVSGSHFTLDNLSFGDYTPINNATCALEINAEDGEPEYGDWQFVGSYLDKDTTNSNGNTATAWVEETDINIIGTGSAHRERTEYYDYYWFIRKGTFVNSDFTEDNVTLYQHKATSGLSIKYDSETNLWVKS